MAETNEYDEIFAALKNPIRRQILLFLDNKGEASFTDIQQEVGIDDTGRMSYHLKELSPLVEQSKRGRYCLSEVGQAGVALFKKVESERQRSTVAVRSEMERYLGETLKKSLLLLGIVGLTLFVPLCLDITLAVEGTLGNGYSIAALASVFLLGLSVMIAGLTLFVLYDRRYYSKKLKTTVIHSTIFAVALSILVSLAFYNIYTFNAAAGSLHSVENLSLMFGGLRTVAFLASAPVITYVTNAASQRESNHLK